MADVIQYWPALLQAVGRTVLIAVLSLLGCAIVSIALGTLRYRGSAAVRFAIATAIELLRGASALVLLFWCYYALPLFLGVPQFNAFWVCVVVLSLVGGAYGADIVAGGLETVPRGQIEAAKSLGLSPGQTLRQVMMPQALARIVPSFGSLAVDLVKWTSIVSFVGVPDLLYVANAIRTETYQTTAVYLSLAVIYWGICSLTGFFFSTVEGSLRMTKARKASAGGRDGQRRAGMRDGARFA